jgi:hypothetical protein
MVQQTTQVITPRDRVRWGPIWAGLLTALTLTLLGSLLALALGAATVDAGETNPATAGRVTGIATAIIAALSFGLGGAIAARTAAVRGRGNGLLNGFLVWALGLPLLLWLATQGLGGLLGFGGDIFNNFRGLAGQGVNQAADAAQRVQPRQLADNIQNGAGTAFISGLVPAAASAIGGLLGARTDTHEREDTY